MANALASETSPYLLQHAHNPVDWMPWGDEAFARARAEDKPVFLSVGYSTCHWCHVMERECFEDPEIAAIMNRCAVNVKVDREERPDLDAAYMAFVQATTGQGGWPMSVWLTPDGKPVFGGTYFPPDDRHGRPGFPRVCKELARLWLEDRDRMLASADRIMEHLRQSNGSHPAATGLAGPDVLDAFLNHCASHHDSQCGGFGSAPKFPRPVVLRALMQLAERWETTTHPGALAADLACGTLRAMAAGGIHDHLGGGFHRYSVDRYWHVPHYEKMLYDQAQLALAYLDAWQLTADPLHRETAAGIFRYLLDTLRDPGGAFHAAEDADSLPSATDTRKREGAFWTWTGDEIAGMLGDDAPLFAAAFGVEADGNARPESDPHGELSGQNTLYQAATPEELAARFDLSETEVRNRLQAASAVLLDARARRPPPHRDDKLVTAWNGLAIAALARGARVLDRPDLGQAAVAAARFIRDHLWVDGILYRSFRGRCGTSSGMPADAVCLVSGLIELHALQPDQAWLTWAEEIQNHLDANCWDETHAGYVMRPGAAGGILLTVRDDHDGAEPSPNHLAAENLLKLAILLDRPDFHHRAEILLRAGTPLLESHPFAAPVLVAALDLCQRGVAKLQVPPATAPEAAARLRNTYLPRAVLTSGPGPDIIVCEGHTCRRWEGS
jgi:uncharacterized protein YyaL (SSP411 family)